MSRTPPGLCCLLCWILEAVNEWTHGMVFRGSIHPTCSSICRDMTSFCCVSLLTSFPNKIPGQNHPPLGSTRVATVPRGLRLAGLPRVPVALPSGAPGGRPPSTTSLGLEETQDINHPLSCCPRKHLDSPCPVLSSLGSVCAMGWPAGPSPLSSNSKILP